MANVTYSDIVTDIANEEGLPPKRLVELGKATPGMTDELFTNHVLDSLGGTYPRVTQVLEYTDDPVIPDLKSVLEKLGIREKDDPTGVKAARTFVDDFPVKREVWKKKIEKDPSFGTRGWKTVQDLYKQTANDLMNYDIAENRRKIASGEGEEGLDWLQTKLANLMAPRVVKAVEEGRDPSASEIFRDAFMNAAYAVPAGRVAGFVTKGRSPITKMLAQAASQAAAPTAVAAVDNAMDSARNADDLFVDALAGTLANMGVNKLIGPAFGRAISSTAGKISSSIPPSVKRVLEGAPTPREEAADIVARARRDVLSASDAFNPTKLMEESVSESAARTAGDILDIADMAKGSLNLNGKLYSPSEILGVIGEAGKATGRLAPADKYQVVSSLVQQMRHPGTAPTPLNRKFTKEFREGAGRYADVLKANEPLLSLFEPAQPFSVARVLSPIEAYAVNQVGTTEEARAAASALPGIDVKKMREDNKERHQKEGHKSSVSSILKGDITAEDEKWLTKVHDNPSMLQYGDKDDPEGFKSWLLRRGNDLLRGTPMYRPAWEAE